MSGSGKGGNNRIKRQRFSGRRDESYTQKQRDNLPSEGNFEKNRTGTQERPHWTTPNVSGNPAPIHECPWCGKPISDISTALSDKNTGKPVHFDCVLSRISEMETLENHDYICYIGGGRFGVVHYNNPPDTRDFTIKKILEWENKDNRFEWRQSISEHFSLT